MSYGHETAELETFIPNFAEWYRQGDTVSTAFIESTMDQVARKRFVKKQQLQWTPQRGSFIVVDEYAAWDHGL